MKLEGADDAVEDSGETRLMRAANGAPV